MLERAEIKALVDRVKLPPKNGAFFLPVDRAFVISGFGTVVTGTAYHSTAKLGDKIAVLPSEREVSFMSHDKLIKMTHCY